MLYSLTKNKIVQRFDFKPSRYQDLGQAVSSVLSPDNKKLAIVFGSGKIQVFNFQNKKLLQKVEVDNSNELDLAHTQWRNLADGRSCLSVFYSYKHKDKVEREVGVFFSKSKEDPLDETHYFNHLTSSEDSIAYCALIDLMIPNQNDSMQKILKDDTFVSKKNTLLNRPAKDRFLKSVLLVGISRDNKIHYCHPQMVQKDNAEQASFKALPAYICFQESKIKSFQYVDLTAQPTKIKETFAQSVEELASARRSEVFLDVIKSDLISLANVTQTKVKYASMAETEAYFLDSVELFS